jgi:hypothetical protein
MGLVIVGADKSAPTPDVFNTLKSLLNGFQTRSSTGQVGYAVRTFYIVIVVGHYLACPNKQ